MKRTLHIEIVRYTRRVTWSSGEGGGDSGADESQTAAILLESPAAAPRGVYDRASSEPAAKEPTAPRLGRLRRLKSGSGVAANSVKPDRKVGASALFSFFFKSTEEENP